MSSYDISLESFTPNDIKAMHSLLNVTEELLFAFPLPSELVKKYESMKEKVFSKINLANNPSKLWKMQREAYAKQKTCKRDIGIQSADQNQDLEKIRDLKWKELEENANVIRWELLARLEASHYINKSYQNLTNLVISSLSHILSRISTILGVQINQNTFIAQLPDDIPHEDPPEVNWNLPELEAQNAISLTKFKELEYKETEKVEDARFDCQQREAQILGLIDQLEAFVFSKEENLDSLQKECKELSEKVLAEQKMCDEKIKSAHEMLTLDKTSLEYRLKKECEDLKISNELAIENVKKTYQLQIERLELEKSNYEVAVKRIEQEKAKVEEGSHETFQALKDDLKKQKDEHRKVVENLHEASSEKEDLLAKIAKLEKQLTTFKEKLHKSEIEIENREKHIEEMKSQWKNETQQMKELYERQIMEANSTIKSETTSLRAAHDQELRYAKQELIELHSKIEEVQYSTQKTIRSLEEELENEQEMRSQLEHKVFEHEQALPEYQKIQTHLGQLKEAHSEAEHALQVIKDKASPIYRKHIQSQRDWNEQERMRHLMDEGLDTYAETALYVEFMIYYLLKSINDNNWLIDRVAELGQEIDKMRYLKASPVKVVMTPTPAPMRDESLHKKIWRDIRGTSRALQEFEKSREKLIQHFQESA